MQRAPRLSYPVSSPGSQFGALSGAMARGLRAVGLPTVQMLCVRLAGYTCGSAALLTRSTTGGIADLGACDHTVRDAWGVYFPTHPDQTSFVTFKKLDEKLAVATRCENGAVSAFLSDRATGKTAERIREEIAASEVAARKVRSLKWRKQLNHDAPAQAIS